MGNFSIHPDNIKDSALQLQNAGEVITSLSPQVDNVADELSELSGMDGVITTVRHLATKVREEGTKTLELGDALLRIINLYETHEGNIVNNQTGTGSASEVAQLNYEADSGKSERTSDKLKHIDPAEKDRLIAEYEKEHPEIAAEFDRIFSNGDDLSVLTPDDIRNIKYMAYTAPEPDRTIFLNNLANITVTDWQDFKDDSNGNDTTDPTAFFSPTNKDIHLNDKIALSGDKKGPYTTVFHESGHAIDDLINPANGSDSDTFTYNSSELGKTTTIEEAIMYDVYDNTDNPHSVMSMAMDINNNLPDHQKYDIGELSHVVEAMRSGGDTSGLTARERVLYRDLGQKFVDGIPSSDYANYESVTDIYGGMSSNALRTDYSGTTPETKYYGHSDNYWKTPNNANKELWAEYFSYKMAGDKENLEHMREYFPEAYKAMEAYEQHLYEETVGGAA